MVCFKVHGQQTLTYLILSIKMIKNIAKALGTTTNNIIILGDMNEDLLNPNMHKLKDVLLLKSLHNIISEPIRQLALLDPIKLHEDMAHLS